MITLIGGLAALLAGLTIAQHPSSGGDPLFTAAVGDSRAQPARMRAEIGRQSRDAAWADPAEATLRRRYAAIAGVDAGSLRITCRSSLCEVLGRSTAGAPAETLKAAERELGSPAMRNSLTAEHLHADLSGSHSDVVDDAYRFAFYAYWRRLPS